MNFKRRDILLAALAAFIAWGWAIRWLPVLRFIGYAFTFGVLLALTAVSFLTLTVSRPRKKQSRVIASNKIPTFLSPGHWQVETTNFATAQEYRSAPLYDDSFVVSQALDSLVTLALRDFMSSWYKNITSSPAFVNEVDKNIRSALLEIRERIFKEDLVAITISRIVPIITTHFKDFDQAEKVVRGRTLNRTVTESEELDLAIAAKYRDGKLHPAASLAFSDTKSIQQEHLRKIMVRMLPDILSEEMMKSRAVSVLVKEIVACAVLFPVVQLLCDSDTWNQVVENYGRATLQDRRNVRRMRAALDEHASPQKIKTDRDLPRLVPGDSERAFERFVRAIRKTKNLSDARRFRSQVASQLKKESMVEGQDPIYLRRLEMGKRVLDQKISKMALAGGVLPAAIAQSDFRNGASQPKQREMTLVEIMHTAAGLSYFMEYMDRQQGMSLVQFWIVVDGVRNPLEDDFGDDSLPVTGPAWTETDRIDIAQISEAYLSRPELKIPQENREATKAFLTAGRKATQEQYQAARTAILSAQSDVLEELESRHFPQFKKSDLYYKFLATDEASTNSPVPAASPKVPSPPSPNDTKLPLQAPVPVRSGSHGLVRGKDLRRAALSATDVRSFASPKLFTDSEQLNRPKNLASSTPLFDDGYDTDPLAHSIQSLGHESLNGDHVEQQQVIENMEAAMNNIMTQTPQEEVLDDDHDTLFGSPSSSQKSIKSNGSPRPSLEHQRIDSVITEKVRPSLATLGLVNTSSRIGVFSDNDLFPDEEKFIEDEYVDHHAEDEKEDFANEIHEAAPGDLGLAEAITLLSNDIERLVSQEAVVDTLTRKAELTNNIAELRILTKSRASLQREIRRKELQRQQYIVQESDNSLYGRSSIRITSVMVGKDDDGHEFAMYVIEVRRQAGDQMPAATWAIARRYSEFHELHSKLRRRYPSTRNLDFPRRRVVMKLQKQVLHSRRIALEAYLQQLLRMPDVCRSRELRSFLSQQAILSSNPDKNSTETQDIVSRIYNSVTDGMDEFLGNVAVLDQLSVAGQNLISAATSQLGTVQNEAVIGAISPGPVAEAEAELRAFEDKELEPFVKPICDIFLEVFELNRGNNWLRGRAVVVVLHQLLGGTVERKAREVVKGMVQEDSLLRYIELVREIMWPGGKMRVAVPRTTAEKLKTKNEATLTLAALIPDLAGSVVGRANAQSAARRISATLNNARLNQHLVFTILDEIINVLFDTQNRLANG